MPAQVRPLRPATATWVPSGVIATACNWPSALCPASAMGTRSTGPAAPVATLHTRAVLSSDTVTAQVPVASTATPRTRLTCMPGSTRSNGAVGGCPAAWAETLVVATDASSGSQAMAKNAPRARSLRMQIM